MGGGRATTAFASLSSLASTFCREGDVVGEGACDDVDGPFVVFVDCGLLGPFFDDETLLALVVKDWVDDEGGLKGSIPLN